MMFSLLLAHDGLKCAASYRNMRACALSKIVKIKEKYF